MAVASTPQTRRRKSRRPAQPARRPFQPSLESLEPRLALSTFTVLNTNNSGADSLRQAILDANANAGADLIAFNLPASDSRHFYYQDNGAAGVTLANVAVTSAADDSTIADIDPDFAHSWWTIQPTAALPPITDAVTIDGTTQPGFAGSPIIELNGAGAGLASGLVITAGNSTVRGLVINRFQAVGTFGSDGKGAGIVLSTNGGNVIEGNYIGTDVSGAAGLGNFRWGVLILAGSSANRVGTNGDGVADAAERNVISGNGTIGNSSTGAGIIVIGTNNNVIAGNYLGTNAAGTAAVGNTNRGISIQGGAQGNRVGTDGNGVADAAERNLLSGNLRNGIVIAEAGTSNNTVAGNYIGTDAAGVAPLANGRFGVSIFSGAQGNAVGGADADLGNTIAFNGEAGVQVIAVSADPIAATGNRIRGNSIYSNTGLGIDLTSASAPDGVTANDTGDTDTGANNLQNFPVIGVAHSGPQTFVSGTLNSLPNTVFTLDFYASPAADPSGFGEGARYLGSQTVSTIGNDASFEFLLDAATTAGEVITATATEEPTGNTSEFGLATPVTDLVVTGTTGNDIYEFFPHATGAVEVFLNSVSQGVSVQAATSDPGGLDQYSMHLGWSGAVSISDLAFTNGDTLLVTGTPDPDIIVKSGDQVTWGSPVQATVSYNSGGPLAGFVGIERVIVDGSDSNDTITDPGTDTTILGGPGDDEIIIDATFGNGVVVDGGDGSDSYVVKFGSLAGPVTVADSGTTGVDTLTVQGTDGDDVIALVGDEVQRGAERVIVAAPVANLVVEAGDGADSIDVGDFTAPIDSLGLDGGAGTNDVTVSGSLPPGVELEVTSATQTVDANIRRRTVNVSSRGLMSVVLYATPAFDASQVNISSVLFAGAQAVKSRLRDVDCDGDLDLVLQFRIQDTDLLDIYADLLAAADQTVNGKLDRSVSHRQTATLAITGKTLDDHVFQGFDTLDLLLSGRDFKDLIRELAAARRI